MKSASLSDLLIKAAAYTGWRHDSVHPCAQTCSGHWQGVDEGAYGMHARLTPLISALAAVAVAVEKEFPCEKHDYEPNTTMDYFRCDKCGVRPAIGDAIAALRKVCGET